MKDLHPGIDIQDRPLTDADIYYLSSPVPYEVAADARELGVHIGIGNRTEAELKDVKTYFFISEGESGGYTLLCESSLDMVPAKQSYFGKINLNLPQSLNCGRYTLKYSLVADPREETQAGMIAIDVKD